MNIYVIILSRERILSVQARFLHHITHTSGPGIEPQKCI